jgi:hypothetical protein
MAHFALTPYPAGIIWGTSVLRGSLTAGNVVRHTESSSTVALYLPFSSEKKKKTTNNLRHAVLFVYPSSER